jgi:hypothetical protein
MWIILPFCSTEKDVDQIETLFLLVIHVGRKSDREIKNMSLGEIEIIVTPNDLKENIKTNINGERPVIARFEKVEKEEKIEKREQKISYANIVRKNLPVVVVKPKL